MEPTTFWQTLRWGALATGGAVGLGVVGRGLYRAGLRVFDDVTERWRKVQHDRLTLAHIATQNELQNVRSIPSDERGRYPLLYGKGGILRDPNNLRAFTLTAVLERWPDLERLDWMHKQLSAMAGVSRPTRALDQLTEAASATVHWPTSVTLDDLLKQSGAQPGLHRLVLGVAVDAGQERIVYGDMQAMVHVLVSGASGFGKSTLLEALAKQLVLGGDCDLAFVDYGINTFGALADYGAYPIADTPGLAVALFKALILELRRRRELFQEYPRVKDLDQFNETTGGDLRPLVCFVDESAGLFAHDGTQGPATELAQMGRKFGLGLVFAGTDFKATTLPTEASGNCGARIALHLRPSLSQSLLGNRAASELRDKGRAVAELPGQPGLVEIQCPIVRRWDDLPPRRPQVNLAPDARPPAAAVDDQAARILELHAGGASDTRIAREVYGHGTTYYIEKVRAVLRQQQQNDNGNGQVGHSEGGDSVVVADNNDV